MTGSSQMMISLRNPIADKLLLLARGDLDRVREAIQVAAGGKASADLDAIVDYLTLPAHSHDNTGGAGR